MAEHKRPHTRVARRNTSYDARACAQRRRITMVKLALLPAIVLILLCQAPALARPLGREAREEIDRLLAPPAIEPEPGFTAKLVVAPGELYDPLFMVSRGADAVWMNDDGKATDGHGSRILALTLKGKISVLVGADKLLPVTGVDVAPRDFGAYGGQIFTIAQPTTGMTKGALANHVIQRIDLATHTVSVFCTLPSAGKVGNGVAGIGVDARFGPAGSAFGAFYAITALNDMIYQARPDGTCKPFADLSPVGAPADLTFTSDASAMLVTISPGELIGESAEGKGMIVRVSPDGKVDPKPVVTGLTRPMGLDIAPSGFGVFSGQIFVTDMGDIQIPVPESQALKHDGKVYRVTKEGELKLVASGFVNPSGAHFVGGHHLWITDINGDFIAGGRELPDGFVVQIDAK